MPFQGKKPRNFLSYCERCGERRGAHFTIPFSADGICNCPDEVDMSDHDRANGESRLRAKEFVRRGSGADHPLDPDNELPTLSMDGVLRVRRVWCTMLRGQ